MVFVQVILPPPPPSHRFFWHFTGLYCIHLRVTEPNSVTLKMEAVCFSEMSEQIFISLCEKKDIISI